MRGLLRSILFSVMVVSGLSIVVPLMPDPGVDRGGKVTFELSQPESQLDVEAIRGRSRSRALKVATDEEVSRLQTRSISQLVDDLRSSDERERALAAAVLGASAHDDGVEPLILAFEREREPRFLSVVALALAETRQQDAVLALIGAIRHRGGLHAYEACKALKQIFGLNLGLDADAWSRWLTTTTAVKPIPAADGEDSGGG